VLARTEPGADIATLFASTASKRVRHRYLDGCTRAAQDPHRRYGRGRKQLRQGDHGARGFLVRGQGRFSGTLYGPGCLWHEIGFTGETTRFSGSTRANNSWPWTRRPDRLTRCPMPRGEHRPPPCRSPRRKPRTPKMADRDIFDRGWAFSPTAATSPDSDLRLGNLGPCGGGAGTRPPRRRWAWGPPPSLSGHRDDGRYEQPISLKEAYAGARGQPGSTFSGPFPDQVEEHSRDKTARQQGDWPGLATPLSGMAPVVTSCGRRPPLPYGPTVYRERKRQRAPLTILG